jgi:cellulose synthase/poly-beta-1,6-N-acetylglucosamine synthase-like glycosyltransferase
MDHVTSDIVMFTDADCRVRETWVEDTVQYFSNPGVGVVAGFTHLDGDGVFTGIQALDWFALFTTASGTVKIGYPLTAVGTNLSVRRSAYEKVGGFRGIPFSVTEDYALFNAITKRSGLKAAFPMDPGMLVESEPCADWSQLYRQKKRWFSGGRGMDGLTLFVFALLYLFHAGLAFGLLVWPVQAVLQGLILKTLADAVLLAPALVRFRLLPLLKHLPAFELYFILYVLVFPSIVLFTRRVDWKGRAYGPVTQA